MVRFLSPPDDRIVVFGQSCSGKTTLAKQIVETHKHAYYCFDAYFHWHAIETLGLSISANLRYLNEICVAKKFVLDGWHLADKHGEFLPVDTRIYVVYAPYQQILRQYRVPVRHQEEFLGMFRRWYYEINYPSLRTRYFLNTEEGFCETEESEFSLFLEKESCSDYALRL